jgi:hypothetical protein
MDCEYVVVERDATGDVVFVHHFLDELPACEAAMAYAIDYARGADPTNRTVELEVLRVFVGEHTGREPEPIVAFSVERGATVSSSRSRFAR